MIAANTYLDRLPAAVRATASINTNADHWRLVFVSAATGLIMAALLKSKAIIHLKARLFSLGFSGWATSCLCAVAFVLIVQSLEAPATLVAEGLWPGDHIGETPALLFAGVILSVLGGAPLLLLLQGVLRIWPRWGWAGLSLAAAIIVFLILLIPPVTVVPGARGDRLASGHEAAQILAFVHKGGLNAPHLDVFVGKDPFSVDMEGLGTNEHAAVSQAALDAPQPETFSAIGHLLGHYRHHDLWSMSVLWSGLLAALLFSLFRVYAPLTRTLGSGLPRSVSDPGALPVIGLLIWVFFLAATPTFNLFDQAINIRADNYAMGLTRDPDALCRWLIATEQISKADPSPVETILFYDHPPLAARLRNAMRWKMSHGL